MELSRKRREETGAFYTPKVWADLAVQYILSVIPDPENYIFYDPAAGEGALLDALPANCTKIASTLEAEDVEILKAKGYENAFQFDFLDESLDILDLYGDIDNVKPSRCLAKAIMRRERLIIFTNPPYAHLPASNNCFAKRKYQEGNPVCLFFLRILFEIQPLMLCSFNKTDIWQASKTMKFRQQFDVFARGVKGIDTRNIRAKPHLVAENEKDLGGKGYKLNRKREIEGEDDESEDIIVYDYVGRTGGDALFLCPSATWPGLSAGWPIAFNMFWTFPNDY